MSNGFLTTAVTTDESMPSVERGPAAVQTITRSRRFWTPEM